MDSPLYDHLLALIQSGNEAAVREFIAKHPNEFSEATRIAILGGSLGKTLTEHAPA